MRARIAIAAVIAVGALTGLILLVVHAVSGGESAARFPFGEATAAAAPFGAFDAGQVRVGDRCLHVLLATSSEQRTQGLRDVTSLAGYDGMLFVFPAETDARFTMAQTPMPLAITWFGADGQPVDTTTMSPCPDGTDATCPQYASKQRYRYALERPAGSSPAGGLGSCT